jgi:2-polyprenyl-3-methyl-5-hydroxy-6-metoxy-1,4-benzoquinol methylase
MKLLKKEFLEDIMLSSKEMIDLQAKEHALVNPDTFQTKEEYALHLVGKSAYNQATRLANNKTVLDFGCNTGFGTEMISSTAKKIVGVDISERALGIAKNRYIHPNIEFAQIDGVTLPFNDQEFDLVVSFQVIEHIIDYSNYLGPIKRVLKPDGFVLFSTPNAEIRLDPGMKPWNKFHVREFIHLELDTLLREYFPCVKVMGLEANEPIRSIEYNRLQKTRETARKNQNNVFRRLIKTVLPEGLQTQLKKLVKPELLPRTEMARFINSYDVDQIYYRPDHLETALDYLAICSVNENTLEQIWRSLPQK